MTAPNPVPKYEQRGYQGVWSGLIPEPETEKRPPRLDPTVRRRHVRIWRWWDPSLPTETPMTRKLLLDILERTVWTAVQAFLATWIVTARFDADTFAVAGTAAAVAAAKCILASRVGDHDSAAALPD